MTGATAPAHTVIMRTDIARKKDTGEPGNGGQFGHATADPSGLQLADQPAGQHWVYIDRQHSQALALGPYPSEEAAAQAMNESLLVEGFVQDDCLDAWTSSDHPTSEFEQVIVDLGDPHHTGESPQESPQEPVAAAGSAQAAAFAKASQTLEPFREQLTHSHDRKTGGWCKAHSDHGQEPCSEPALCDVAYALDNLPSKPTGTMRSWMLAAAGRTVHTVQVQDRTGKAWAPTSRLVDASRAGHVTLGGSRRDYAGMRVIGANESTLLVADGSHTIVYVLDSQTTA